MLIGYLDVQRLAFHFNYVKCSRITRGGSGARPPGGLHCGFSSNGPIDRQQTPYPRWTRAADDLTELRCITRSGAQSTGTSSVIIAHSSYSSLCTSPPLGARPSILLPMHANTISHKQKLQRKKGRPHKSSSHENPSGLGEEVPVPGTLGVINPRHNSPAI